jgi:hypothetical protein
MQGGGARNGPRAMRARVGTDISFGHGRPAAPHTMSQTISPSTGRPRLMISALSCVGSVKAALQINDGATSALQSHRVITSRPTLRGVPPFNVPAVFQVIENMPGELALLTHCRRELAAHLFDRPSKQGGAVKVGFRQTVITESMRLGLQCLGETRDVRPQPIVAFARDDAHAAANAREGFPSSGSSKLSARWRTTSTATPSPVRWYASL